MAPDRRQSRLHSIVIDRVLRGFVGLLVLFTRRDFVADLGWRDPHRIAGWALTWPAFMGRIGSPIVHIFISNERRLHDYEVGPAVGSDHGSLHATISLAD